MPQTQYKRILPTPFFRQPSGFYMDLLLSVFWCTVKVDMINGNESGVADVDFKIR